jgi:hypothetical protein
MTEFQPGRQSSLILLLLTSLIGLTLASTVTYFIPGFLIFSAAAVCGVVAYAMYRTYANTHRRWAMWAVTLALVLAGTGALMLAESLGTVRGTEPAEVTVVSHTMETKEEGWDRTHRREHNSYVHRYTLKKADGSVLEEPLVFYGSAGYDGVDKGKTITVLIDPDDGTPLRPTGALHIELGTTLTVLGLITVFCSLGMCALLVHRDANRAHDRHSR